MRHNIDVVQRQKKELRDELERQTTALKKEIDVLNRNRDESLKKSGGQQAALDRLHKMLDSKQAELNGLTERARVLENKSKSGEMYKIKYNNVRTYLKNALYQSGQMSMERSGATAEWNHGRFNFFAKIIKDLGLDEHECGANN